MQYKIYINGELKTTKKTQKEARKEIYDIKKRESIKRFGWGDCVMRVPDRTNENEKYEPIKIWMKGEIRRL